MKIIKERVHDTLNDLTLILAALRAPNDNKWYGAKTRRGARGSRAPGARGTVLADDIATRDPEHGCPRRRRARRDGRAEDSGGVMHRREVCDELAPLSASTLAKPPCV